MSLIRLNNENAIQMRFDFFLIVFYKKATTTVTRA